jgi:hypothetical protein
MTCKHTTSTVTYCRQCETDDYIEDLEYKYKQVLKKNKIMRKQLKETK